MFPETRDRQATAAPPELENISASQIWGDKLLFIYFFFDFWSSFSLSLIFRRQYSYFILSLDRNSFIFIGHVGVVASLENIDN